ncbi:hypothetical protein GCM10009827_099350 [Dactylosporangium maewongense]|uniref:Uncharacterized protein n=1 Tax=Dactylosporangium maewongense TaxID=634393 RepID=A0ABP4NII6_9ACTN
MGLSAIANIWNGANGNQKSLPTSVPAKVSTTTTSVTATRVTRPRVLNRSIGARLYRPPSRTPDAHYAV